MFARSAHLEGSVLQGYFLTEDERERQRRFPEDIPPRDVSDYFTLSEADRRRVYRQRGAHNRLGFALQLCALRYLGFAPDDLTTAPVPVVSYVAEQLGEAPASLGAYGNRAHTRTDHLHDIMDHLGFHKVTTADWRRLSRWLVERALEHDKPSLLLQLACDRLRRDKIVRPGITRLERPEVPRIVAPAIGGEHARERLSMAGVQFLASVRREGCTSGMLAVVVWMSISG